MVKSKMPTEDSWKPKESHRSKIFSLLLPTCIMALLLSSYALLSAYWNVPNQGQILTVGVVVYQDAGLTIPLTSLNWGMLEPGSDNYRSVYVKNNGTTMVTLNLTVVNWSPVAASNYISVTWGCEGIELYPDDWVLATLMLSVSPSITGVYGFTFDMVFTGTG